MTDGARKTAIDQHQKANLPLQSLRIFYLNALLLDYHCTNVAYVVGQALSAQEMVFSDRGECEGL